MITDISRIEEEVLNYVTSNSHVDKSKITSQKLLFKEGLLDSMAFVLLIDFLEEKFKIKVGDSDLIEDNFESIEKITGFISSKLHSMAA